MLLERDTLPEGIGTGSAVEHTLTFGCFAIQRVYKNSAAADARE
jgi:hypothetical protein